MEEDIDHPLTAKINWKTENYWATIGMKLVLDVKSTNLWAEFVGFTHLLSMEMHNCMLYAYNEKKLQEWAERECRNLDEKAKKWVNYHHFFYPPETKWLNIHTRVQNQTILLATATPPVVIDASTDEPKDFRFPPQWSVFPRFHEKITILLAKILKRS